MTLLGLENECLADQLSIGLWLRPRYSEKRLSTVPIAQLLRVLVESRETNDRSEIKYVLVHE